MARLMGACGGCGATLSPAQPYCHACGRSRQPHVEITLERLASDPARGGVAPPPVAGRDATPAPPTLTAAPGGRRPPGWPVATGVLLVVALCALGVALVAGGSGDDPASSAPTSAPPGATSATTPVPEVAGTSTSRDEPGGSPSTATAPNDAASTTPPASTGGGWSSGSSAPAGTAGAAERAAGASAPGSPSAAEATPTFDGPPLGEPLPYDVVAVDNTGRAVVFDLATGATSVHQLAVGPIFGEPITDVIGGPRGPIVLRTSLSSYHLVELDEPAPIEVDQGRITALDEESGWVWFSTCRTPPCPAIPVIIGFGPGAMQGRSFTLPAPTTRVVATAGWLFVEAAGTVIRIDPSDGTRTIVATGLLLDARGSTVVVRSCDPDLACPVVLHDADGVLPPRSIEVEGDDIRLSPDGSTIVAGSTAPSLARTLRLIDVRTGQSIDVGSDALRFVSVPFRWTPDGNWLIGATGARVLVAVRVSDGLVHRVQFPGLDNAIAGLFVRPHEVRGPER